MPRTLIKLTLDWGIDPEAGTRRLFVDIHGARMGEGQGSAPFKAPGLYHWSFVSTSPAEIDSFQLEPKPSGAHGKASYDVFSTTRQSSLAELTDGSIQMVSAGCVSGECSAGHFEIKEPFLDQVKDGLNFGRSRRFLLTGHPQGEIRFESSPGINDIELDFDSPGDALPDVRAVMVAAILLLYKGIAHYD